MKTRFLVAALTFLMAAFSGGCGKKKKQETTNPGAGSTAEGPALAPDARGTGVLPRPTEGSLTARVQFEFDRAELTGEARRLLSEAAGRLIAAPESTVTIEGHADERGSTQYNLALSERRATAVARYLADAGVSETRMQTVAYGEEKPLDTSHDEAAWSKNRRGDVLAVREDRVAMP